MNTESNLVSIVKNSFKANLICYELGSSVAYNICQEVKKEYPDADYVCVGEDAIFYKNSSKDKLLSILSERKNKAKEMHENLTELIDKIVHEWENANQVKK